MPVPQAQAVTRIKVIVSRVVRMSLRCFRVEPMSAIQHHSK
jgi:hypothetical protein